MAKGAATEKALASLHAQVAQVIENQLKETVTVNPDEVELGEEAVQMYVASPALLTVAARFLKDNDITVDTGAQADNTSKIRDRLDQLKRNRGKVVSLSDIHPVAADG